MSFGGRRGGVLQEDSIHEPTPAPASYPILRAKALLLERQLGLSVSHAETQLHARVTELFATIYESVELDRT